MADRELDDRFWAKVDRSAGPDACWPWIGGHNVNGYGQYRVGGRGGRSWLAHRLAWKLTYGRLPRDQHVLHGCDNPPCVNPTHLHLGTQQANLEEMRSRGRKFIPAGERHPRARLHDQDIAAIRAAFVASRADAAALGARFGVTVSHIQGIRRGVKWRHVSG